MKVSEQRLDDILNRLRDGQDTSSASREEWMSLAMELKQLRLRTSAQSRVSSASQATVSSS